MREAPACRNRGSSGRPCAGGNSWCWWFEAREGTVAEGPLPAVCIVMSASTEEKFPIRASRYRWADPRLIRRQLFRHCLVFSLLHCLQEREVDGRDDRRDLSASARDQHRLPSEGRTIDRLREVVAKLVCADGRENLGRTEVIELRCPTSKNGRINSPLAVWAAKRAPVRGTTHAKTRERTLPRVGATWFAAEKEERRNALDRSMDLPTN